MGAVQKLATVVIVGLVALATLLVIYLADEPHRRSAEAEEQKEASIERGIATYVKYCVVCHGPAGEGLQEPGAKGTGRIGFPLGGHTDATLKNQKGVDAAGTPVAGGLAARTTLIRKTLHNGRGRMPAWGEENGGELNDEQINDLVTMIQNVDWDEVYNHSIAANGGKYPVPPPAENAAGSAAAPGSQQGTATPAQGGGTSFTVDMVDIAFQPTELTIPANTPVKIRLVNKGASVHNFDIDVLNVHSGDIQGGAAGEVTINAKPGDYEYYCSQPGHKEAGMVGKLHVSGNAAAAPPAQQQGQAAPQQGAGGAQPVNVDMLDIAFQPTTITIPANTPVKVMLPNKGASVHNFDIDALDVHSGDIQGGASGEVTINAKPGEYEYYCSQPGHKDAGMIGKLIVK